MSTYFKEQGNCTPVQEVFSRNSLTLTNNKFNLSFLAFFKKKVFFSEILQLSLPCRLSRTSHLLKSTVLTFDPWEELESRIRNVPSLSFAGMALTFSRRKFS